MALPVVAFYCLLFVINSEIAFGDDSLSTNAERSTLKEKTVMVAILVRNKAHALPYFLTCLEKLDYPKDQITLWIRSDHNVDNSIDVLETWLDSYSHLYNKVISELHRDSTNVQIEGEESVAHWPISRQKHVISLRESALKAARQMLAHYVWMLDSDVFITNRTTLKDLISKNLSIVAPLLFSDGLYSNFWCGMSDNFYYMRTDNYDPIIRRKDIGCFTVPMVHSSVLIDLSLAITDNLTYDPANLTSYSGPIDDIITFSQSAKVNGINMSVCNNLIYGYVMLPMDKDDPLHFDYIQLKNLKVLVLVNGPPLEVDLILANYVVDIPEPVITVNKTFMINLKRRPDRRIRMTRSFDELNLDVEIFDAVDGRSLSEHDISNLGISMMPGYEDPYHKRAMKKGEIGCFLSHFFIWEEVIRQNYEIVMILEDDVRFESFFNQKMLSLLKELRNLPFEWDLVFLGRKKLHEKNEQPVEGTNHLVWADYSYWTIGYLLSQSGAKKLVAQNPLGNLLPVDEYLPLLYDKHPSEDWKAFYPKRDLVAMSVEPLILYPMRYLNEEGYISDTEDSALISGPDPKSEL